MIRVADYIAQTLAAHGVRHVFMVTGGGAMHLNDAFGRNKAFEVVCCHHEQACAIAAEAYTRVTGRLAVVNVTAGPGGINAMNGVFGAWVDSIPMLVVSGQVKRETLLSHHKLGGVLRQLGDQEAEIVRMVTPITKYAVEVCDLQRVRYHVERAVHLATHGRPGPCWLDVPIDVQGAQMDPAAQESYDPTEDAVTFGTTDLPSAAAEILARLAEAKRPVIYAGSGVRSSGAHAAFLALVETLGIPVVTAWNQQDLLWDAHPCYVGIPGSVGTRAGNFAVQNADLLLILGCRLNIRLVSYNWTSFSRHSYKIWVDVDAAELEKPTVRPDLPIHADLRELLPMLAERAAAQVPPDHASWLGWCRERVDRYPVVLPEYWNNRDSVNPYCFMETLFAQLEENELVVSGDGTACVTAFQAGRIKRGQRVFHNSGCASMGYDIPAAVGAAISTPGQRVVCLAGDGSAMMNLQELQTISGLRLPVKIFILNNSGYHSIRQTQQNFFPDNIVGCGIDSGLSFPNWEKLAAGFGLAFHRCADHSAMAAAIEDTLRGDGPALCEVMLDLDQQFAPKLSSRRLADGRMITAPLEDMAPFLSREELRDNLLIPMEEA